MRGLNSIFVIAYSLGAAAVLFIIVGIYYVTYPKCPEEVPDCQFPDTWYAFLTVSGTLFAAMILFGSVWFWYNNRVLEGKYPAKGYLAFWIAPPAIILVLLIAR